MKMTKKVWFLLRTYCLESTLIGPRYFYLYPDAVSRCFWAFHLMTATSLSGLIAWLLYSRFLDMPTQITIENQFESMNKMPYPTITLCSPTQITVSSVQYFNKSLVDGQLSVKLEEALLQLRGFYESVHLLKQDDLRQLQNVLDVNRYTIPEVMAKLSLSCEQFLKRCIFENKLYDCKDLFQPIITAHGYCCAFNSKYYFDGKRTTLNPLFKNHTVKTIGFPFSLTVVTDYEPNEVLKDSLHDAGSTRMMISDVSEFPGEFESLLVEPNAEAFLFLRVIFTYCSEDVRLLPSSSRECNFEHEETLPYFRDYHNSDCFISCYIEAVHKACHCLLFFVPHLKLQQVCKLTDISCIKDVRQNSSWIMPDQCKCPRDCESRKYSVNLSVGNFHAISYLIEPANPYIGLTLNESSSALNFFFQSSVYVKQKQETVMSIISLISNLGGVFGLFLGCSGISLLEISFYIYRGINRSRVKTKE